MRKGKGEKVKRAKDEEVNGQGKIKGGKGVPRTHAGTSYMKPSLVLHRIADNAQSVLEEARTHKSVKTHNSTVFVTFDL